MNVDTGELIRLRNQTKAPEGFTPVPKQHREEANKLLGEKDSVFVNMSKKTPLTDWADRQKRGKLKKSRWCQIRKDRKKGQP